MVDNRKDQRVRWFNRLKRISDVLIVLLSAPIVLPTGFAAAAIVRAKIGSPILFRQQRIGMDETPFNVLKFRTMTDERDRDGDLLPDAVRLTRFGALLRATSLDELPQLLNVIRGDMSLVGPRPLFVRYLPHYTADERNRHLVRPGITGLAQVSGRNELGWDDRLRKDVEYVEAASLRMDAKVLVKTLGQVLRRSNVSVLAFESGEPLDVERSYPADECLAIRRLGRNDLETRVKWANDPRVREHMRWPDGITLDSTEAWFSKAIRDRSRLDVVAVDRVLGCVVAMAGLTNVDSGTAEFYIFVDPERQGLGIGQRLTSLVLAHASRDMEVREVTLSVAKGNASARAVYEAVGFEVVRCSPDRLWMMKTFNE